MFFCYFLHFSIYFEMIISAIICKYNRFCSGGISYGVSGQIFNKKEPGSLTRLFVSLLLFVGISFKRKHNIEIKTSIFYYNEIICSVSYTKCSCNNFCFRSSRQYILGTIPVFFVEWLIGKFNRNARDYNSLRIIQ